jgi:acetyl-CoA carboxylase biotin carboxyl carrier protein
MELMAKHGIAELELQGKDIEISLKTRFSAESSGTFAGGGAPAPAAPVAAPVPQATGSPAATEAKLRAAQAAEAPAESGKTVSSPFVGTFYRAPSPQAAPYVQEGQLVRKGETLCIIEAMKLMNPIEAEFSGKVVAILVENGQPVEFGQPLFRIQA